MTLKHQPKLLWVTLLVATSAIHASAQVPAGRRTPAPQAAVQPFTIGEAVEIQAADGSWIGGTIRNFDPASGKYEVVLVNSMSGWAGPASLRKAAAGQQAAPAAPQQFAPPQAAIAGGQIGQAAAPATPSVCVGLAMCSEVRDFGVIISNFRLSSQSTLRIADATLRFINKTGAPLALGYVDGSGGIVDDQGNRFIINNDTTIRGIGIVRGAAIDPKFVLQPGETGDTQFQFVFNHNQQQILGTAFELGLTVRELNAVGGAQYRAGSEFPLHFLGLGQTAISAAPVPSAQGAVASPVAAAPGTAAGVAPAPAAAPTTTGTKARGAFAGLSQAAGMIPGLNRGQASGTTTATQGQTPAAGGTASTIASQIAAFAGGQTPAATPNGTAAAPASGGVSGVLSQAATMIPGFSAAPAGGTGQTTASGFAASAAALIPGFSGSPAAGLVPAGGAAPATAGAPGTVVTPGDPCAGQANCVNAGAFAATLARIIGVNVPTGYTLRVQVGFRNAGAQPVMLSYVPGSATAADNAGSRYAPRMNGTTDQSVAGMGAMGSAQAGQFVLNPGQSRIVTLTLVRPAAVKTALGTSFTVNFQVMQMNGASGQVVPLQARAIAFSNVACQACMPVPATAATPASAAAAPATTNNNATNAIKNAITKKK